MKKTTNKSSAKRNKNVAFSKVDYNTSYIRKQVQELRGVSWGLWSNQRPLKF